MDRRCLHVDRVTIHLLTAQVPEGQPTRKFAYATLQLHVINGQRIVRKTRIYVDAASGQPLDVWSSDHVLPPMIRWADEA